MSFALKIIWIVNTDTNIHFYTSLGAILIYNFNIDDIKYRKVDTCIAHMSIEMPRSCLTRYFCLLIYINIYWFLDQQQIKRKEIVAGLSINSKRMQFLWDKYSAEINDQKLISTYPSGVKLYTVMLLVQRKRKHGFRAIQALTTLRLETQHATICANLT